MGKQCPMCRCGLGVSGGIVAECDDAGQHFTFEICARCGYKARFWSMKIRRQQIRAAVGLLAANPQRYAVRFFDSRAAAKLYVELEADDRDRAFLESATR